MKNKDEQKEMIDVDYVKCHGDLCKLKKKPTNKCNAVMI